MQGHSLNLKQRLNVLVNTDSPQSDCPETPGDQLLAYSSPHQSASNYVWAVAESMQSADWLVPE